MPIYTLNINGSHYEIDVESDTPLLWVLRDHLNLVGTKYGCGVALCGACTIHVDGNAVRSCSFPVSSAENTEIITIEGLSENGDHPVQKAWLNVDVSQCGYCQAGQIMTAAAFLKRNPDPTEAEIKEAMNGNLCRCGAYLRIKKAIQIASQTE